MSATGEPRPKPRRVDSLPIRISRGLVCDSCRVHPCEAPLCFDSTRLLRGSSPSLDAYNVDRPYHRPRAVPKHRRNLHVPHRTRGESAAPIVSERRFPPRARIPDGHSTARRVRVSRSYVVDRSSRTSRGTQPRAPRTDAPTPAPFSLRGVCDSSHRRAHSATLHLG